MAKLKLTLTPDAISETSGGSYIAKSGLYPVTIDFVSIATSKNGAKSLNFNITHNGNAQTLYSQTIVNTNGTENEIGQKFLTKLAVIAGVDLEDGLNTEEEDHPAGKEGKIQTFEVITDFSGIDVIMHLQEEYSRYNGEIRKRMVIKSIFRADKATAEEIFSADKATAEEIVNDSYIGKRYAETEAKYADKVTYLDDLTEEDVIAWRESKKSGSTAKPAAAKTTSKAPTASLFKRS